MNLNTKRDYLINEVTNVLLDMNESDKDEWIIKQAKLLNNNQLYDFIKSLRDDKAIQDMPDFNEIRAFSKNVRNEKIYLTYFSQYVKDDKAESKFRKTETRFQDPYNILNFLERVFLSCHDLLKIDYENLVIKIFNEIIDLKFRIKIAKNSQKIEPPSKYFTILDLFNNKMLNTDMNMIGVDFAKSYFLCNRDAHPLDLSKPLVKHLTHPFCKNLKIQEVFSNNSNSHLYLSNDLLKAIIIETQYKMRLLKNKLNKEYDSLSFYEYDELEDEYYRKKDIEKQLIAWQKRNFFNLKLD